MGLNVLNGLSGAAPRGNSIRARREMRKDLDDERLEHYNDLRPHPGERCRGP